MPVQQEGGLTGCVRPIGIHEGVRGSVWRIDETRVFQPRTFQPGPYEIGCAANFSSIGRIRADAGDTQKPDQFVHFPYNGIFIGTPR